VLKTFKELVVWQKSFALCKRIYRATKAFPADERFGLTSQLRRVAVSIPSNIAEGYGRATTRDYVRFLWIANGSVAELETQLMLANELGLLSKDQDAGVIDEVAEVERMLKALIRSLDAKAGK